MRSPNVSRHLTLEDAVEIWQQRWTGKAQHLLAAEYNVNPGRIAEVLSGKRFPESRGIALANSGDSLYEHNKNILRCSLPLETASGAVQQQRSE